jgi:hypothetical protein
MAPAALRSPQRRRKDENLAISPTVVMSRSVCSLGWSFANSGNFADAFSIDTAPN